MKTQVIQTVVEVRDDDAIRSLSDCDARRMYSQAILSMELHDPAKIDDVDSLDMERMGRRQEIKRVFRGYSLISFTCLVTSTWEYLMLTLNEGLMDGGRAGLFWSFIWSMVGYTLIYASLAEMASMAPSAGAHYHWVSEFAPKGVEKILSYLTGWLSVMHWQAYNALGYLMASSLFGMLVSAYLPGYSTSGWKTVLQVTICAVAVTVCNCFAARKFPLIQNMAMILHVSGFLIIVVTLWVLAEHVRPQAVFLNFTNSGGWHSTGVAVMVGQLITQGTMGPTDSAVHMAEEVYNASLRVPKAMMQAFFLNSSMALILLVTFLFSLPDIDSALSSRQPLFAVVRNAWPTTGYVYVICIMLVLIMLGNISFCASTARLTLAFARNKGVPLSSWFTTINARLNSPINAIMACSGVAVALSLICLSSTSTFTAILSIGASCQMSCCIISISCLVWRRTRHPDTLPVARWSLGRYGVVINCFALAYAAQVWMWSFWPMQAKVTDETMNFAPVGFAGMLVAAGVFYLVHGRKHYTSPASVIEARHIPRP